MAIKTGKFSAKVKQVRDAAASVIPAGTVLSLDGQKVKLADFLAQLDGLLAHADAAARSKAQVTAAVKATAAVTPAVRAQILALKAWLILEFGKGSPLLAPVATDARRYQDHRDHREPVYQPVKSRRFSA